MTHYNFHSLNKQYTFTKQILTTLDNINMNKDYIDYLNTQMRYFRSFDIDMYIHYRNKLRKVLNKK